jgi:hypothetical protein
MHIADVIGLLVQMDIRAANTSHSALLSRGSICRANLCSPSPAANAMPRSILFLSGRHRGAARISQSTVSVAQRPFSILTAWFADAVSIFPTMR